MWVGVITWCHWWPVTCCSLPQKHKAEIEARAGNFHSFETFGMQLLSGRHYASGDIQDMLDSVKEERKALEK